MPKVRVSNPVMVIVLEFMLNKSVSISSILSILGPKDHRVFAINEYINGILSLNDEISEEYEAHLLSKIDGTQENDTLARNLTKNAFKARKMGLERMSFYWGESTTLESAMSQATQSLIEYIESEEKNSRN